MKWTIGAIDITNVVELEIAGGSKFILPQATREEVLKIGWLRPHFADAEGRLKMAVQSFLVRTPTQRIIVDTGLGNDKKARGIPAWNDLHGRFLDDITAQGFAPETVDAVICTHLHVDHVGWNARLVDRRWVPTFPNARYVWSRKEYDFWHARRDDPRTAPLYGDSIKPIIEAGLVDFVDSDHRFSDDIHFIPTPGHSPGHMSIAIESAGHSAILTGDAMHHPCQIAHLDWATPFDSDPQQSTATRRALCARLAGSDTLVIGGHFTGPGAGYMVQDGETFRLEPAE